jgi:putative tryptophan/tyrosine transport system substrate-binding protein
MTPGTSPTRRLVLAAAGALLLTHAARGQMAKRRRIAFLTTASRAGIEPYLGTFRQGLRALGYGDEDIAIEIRGADGHYERLPDLAAELVHLAPEVIVATSTPAAQAAKQGTATIPIVMAASGDPVGSGFVASLAHPGGNITGLSTVAPEMAGKWLQLLKTAIPGASRIAFLGNLGNLQQVPLLQAAQQAARTLRTDLLSIDASTSDELDGAFATMAREHAEALIVTGDPVFFLEKTRIVELAASRKLPAIYQWREFAAIGGLMSYGPDLNDLFRRAATYVDKILKGAKPADLPVEQPTKFQLVVNLKTAQALGLTIPPVILAGADEVIE